MLDDAAIIAALTDAAYEKYVARIGRKPQPMTADYAAFIREEHVWVTCDDARVVGALVLMHRIDHTLVYSIAVQPDLQKQGFGRALLAHAEAQARERGLAEVRLYTNERMTENIAWYARMGYIETSRDGGSGFSRVNMAKQLENV